VGRRLLPLIALCACVDKPAAHRPDGAPAVATVRAPDAAALPEPAEAPLPPFEVLGGVAAEKAIADLPAAPPEPTVGPRFLISPTGVGPFRLGMPRNAVLALRPPRWLSPAFAGGRLVEVDVLAADPAAVTDGEIGIGATLAAAVEAHGEARPSGKGVVLADLPGVVFVVAGDRIARIAVVGPESD
jgi:hypothetical protein